MGGILVSPLSPDHMAGMVSCNFWFPTAVDPVQEY